MSAWRLCERNDGGTLKDLVMCQSCYLAERSPSFSITALATK